jgi:hypothetical protein
MRATPIPISGSVGVSSLPVGHVIVDSMPAVSVGSSPTGSTEWEHTPAPLPLSATGDRVLTESREVLAELQEIRYVLEEISLLLKLTLGD